MRIVNEKYETITEAEADLTVGYLCAATVIRENAQPVDNKTKFAWADEDYEEVQVYHPSKAEPEEKQTGDAVTWDELDAAYQEGVDSV